MKGTLIEQTYGKMVEEGHLGGFLDQGDAGTYYPELWDYMLEKLPIKSVLDIGCGRGYSAKYFQSLGCKVLGIDGSLEAQKQSLIPDDFILCDYSAGKLPLNRTFDLVWSCEFVEHVEEKYMDNYMEHFLTGRFVAMTFAAPGQWGHHHVNCQPQEYWINQFEKKGFLFLEKETNDLRSLATLHFRERGLFFINNR